MQEQVVSSRELERGKRMCMSHHQLGLQTASEQAFTVCIDELYGLGYEYHLRYESEINAVTAEDIKRVASKYLQTEKKNISVLKPER